MLSCSTAGVGLIIVRREFLMRSKSWGAHCSHRSMRIICSSWIPCASHELSRTFAITNCSLLIYLDSCAAQKAAFSGDSRQRCFLIRRCVFLLSVSLFSAFANDELGVMRSCWVSKSIYCAEFYRFYKPNRSLAKLGISCSQDEVIPTSLRLTATKRILARRIANRSTEIRKMSIYRFRFRHVAHAFISPDSTSFTNSSRYF